MTGDRLTDEEGNAANVDIWWPAALPVEERIQD
jgi:hypothetical protein